MGDIAEELAKQAAISREQQDRIALESHRSAARAIESGAFTEEIVPVVAPRGSEDAEVTRDEGPRNDTSLERLAALVPVFRIVKMAVGQGHKPVIFHRRRHPI